jgi:hypothetical protein
VDDVIAVLIFGSRNLPERRPVWTVLNGIAAWRADPAEPILVIEGGCPTGADLFAKEWAEGSPWPNIHHKQYPPDRRRTDNRRFYERNVRIPLPQADWTVSGQPAWCWPHTVRPWAERTGRF